MLTLTVSHLHMTVIGLFPELICTLFMFLVSSRMVDVPCGVHTLDQCMYLNRVTGVTVDREVMLWGRGLYSDISR